MSDFSYPRTRPSLSRSAVSWAGLVCAVSLAAFCSNPVAATILDPRTIHSATLNNGLRLVVCEDADATVISVDLVIRAGSAADPPDRSGMAHLLEHALWSSAGDDDPRRRVEDLGGVINAGVLRDFTHFYLTVPAAHLQLAVEALSDLALSCTFGPADLARERAIIEQESLSRLDNPRAILSDLAFEELYGPDHPYARPTDGEADAVRTIGPAQLSLFHQTWYVPNNMALIITGRVTFDQAFSLVQSNFGHLTPVALHPRSWPPLIHPPRGREKAVHTGLAEAYVMAAFLGPTASEHREVCATDLVATLLAHGSSGRLARELREKRQLVSRVGVDFLTQHDRALFGVWAVCRPEDVPAVKQAILAELRRVSGEPIPPDEFAAARRLLAAGYAFANETPADRAAALGFYEAIDTYRTASQYLPRVSLLTPSDVAAVAVRYSVEPVWIVLSPKVAEQ